MEAEYYEECVQFQEESYFHWSARQHELCENFAYDTWNISKRVMNVVSGKKNGSFYLTTNGCGSIVVVESEEDLNHWHQRFAI